jgi:hypothetical protein
MNYLRMSVNSSFFRGVRSLAMAMAMAMSSGPISTEHKGGCCAAAERSCFVFATWTPITIVYGATLWAVFVNVFLLCIRVLGGIQGAVNSACGRVNLGWTLALLGSGFYAMCIWSYSVAVFTDPGSPLEAVPPPHTS